MLTPEFIAKMQELYWQFSQHDAAQSHPLARYRNIEPESALFLNMQVRMQAAKNILEIGTSTGYSTLWLANAALAQHGQVTTLEIDLSRIEQAQHYAQDLALIQSIEFVHQDALTYLQQMTRNFDFVLLDAERDAYVDYWPYLSQNLLQGGSLVVDNVISHAEEVREFIAGIEQDSRFISSTLNIGAGLLLVIANQPTLN